MAEPIDLYDLGRHDAICGFPSQSRDREYRRGWEDGIDEVRALTAQLDTVVARADAADAEREAALDALASAVQDYRQAEAEVRALTARLDAIETTARAVLDIDLIADGYDAAMSALNRLRAATADPTPHTEESGE